MKVVDLHPEELLDKDARGALSGGERALLEAHLARCATCRFERLVRADFALERSADVGLTDHRLALLVDAGVGRRAGAKAPAPPAPSAPTAGGLVPSPSASKRSAFPARALSRLRRAGRGRTTSLLAATAVLAAAFALTFGLHRVGQRGISSPTVADVPAPGVSLARANPVPPPGTQGPAPGVDVGPGNRGSYSGEPLHMDDEAFFTVESFDESQGGTDVLEEPWDPRAIDPDTVPSARKRGHAPLSTPASKRHVSPAPEAPHPGGHAP